MQSTRWPTAFSRRAGKLFGILFWKHHHLGLVVEVGLRDEASVNHVKPVEVAGRWENPGETGFHICCVSCHAGLPAVEFGGHLLHHVALLAAEGVDVVVLEIYASSLSVATVRLGGHAAPYRNLLVVAVHHILLERAYDGVGGAHQSNQHEYAPRHRQPGKGRAELVVAHCL